MTTTIPNPTGPTTAAVVRDTRPRPALYAYLAVAYPADVSIAEIQAHAASLGYEMTENAIHKLAIRRKIKRTAKMGRVPNRQKSTPQLDFLRAHYGTDVPAQWLLDEANKLGRQIPSIRALRRMSTNLGVRRPESAKFVGLALGRGPGFAGEKYKALLAAALPVSWEVADAWARENVPAALDLPNRGNRAMKINLARRVMGLPFFKMLAEVKVRKARNVAASKAVVAKALPVRIAPPADMPGVVNGYRLAGWPEILRYWREHDGKGWPAIGDVNEIRRRNGRHPYKPMAGKFSPVPSARAA